MTTTLRTVLIMVALVLGGIVAAVPAHAAIGKPTATILSVSPPTVAPGGAVTVSGGGGFTAGESITVALSGQTSALATAQADGFGNLPSTPVTIPASVAAGSYTITAAGATSGHVASVGITVSTPSASLTLSVVSIQAGGTVVALGTGFIPNEPILLAISGQSGTLASTQADNSGNLPSISLTIPASLPTNSYTITATGTTSGRVGSANLAVTGTTGLAITVSPSTVSAGGTVILSGTGFAAGESVAVTISGQATPLATLQTDGSGNLPATTLTVPSSLATGSYTATAIGASSGRAATAALTVNRAQASLTLSAGSVEHGGTVAVSGAGFSPNESIILTLSGQSGALAAAVADGSGNLSATSLTIPASLPPSSYTLTATGASSGVTASAVLTVNGVALSLSPSAVTAGGTGTVTGSGFAPNEPVVVAISGQATPLATVQTDGSGNLLATNVTIPASLPAGSYTLTATGANSGDAGSAFFTASGVAIPATITVSTTTTNPGSTLSLSGSGFAAGESVIVALSGQSGSLASAQADGSGNLAATTLTIPSSLPVGSYTLTATGLTSGHLASAGLTVTTSSASLTLNVGSLAHGATVVATATGFLPGEPITLALSGQSAALTTAQADGSGNLPSTTLAIPASLPAGSYTITATGTTSGRAATAGLTVNAVALALSPSAVTAGGTVSLSGSGFAPNESVGVTLGGQATTLTTVQTDGSGNVTSTAVTIPASLPAGSYTLTATGSGSVDAASASLTVNGAVVAPTPIAPAPTVPTAPQPVGPATLSIAARSALQGAAIAISGAGFAPNELVTVTLSGLPSAIATLRADSAGTIPAGEVTIPASAAPGAHTLKIIGATSGGAATGSIAVLSRTHAITLSSSSVQTGKTLTLKGAGFGLGEQLRLALNGVSLSTKSPVISTGTGAFTAVITVPSSALNGSNIVVATGATSGISAKANLAVKTVLTPRWYVTGASNTGTARSTIVLHNAQAQPARVTIALYYANGRIYTHNATVSARGQLSLAVASLNVPIGVFGVEISADRSLTTQVNATSPGHPSTVLHGVANVGTTWRATTAGKGTSPTQLSILNTSASAAAKVQLRLVSGSETRTVTISVPAHSNDVVHLTKVLAGQKGTLTVSSNRPLIVAIS